MARRERYSDKVTGEVDKNIRAIIECRSNESSVSRMKKILLNVINNELTPRQKEIIMLYYFKGIDTVTIARQCGITPQAVSALMFRARKRMYRIMKYCL
ncbi:MAG: sigma-70 family RNA polymerase sigma factor [Prevotella sp.]|nr:sigma-70 family RNA polymerase sigma factor [Alistipes senegalensis]MCM1357271.1 sigma-70 family RNA polymerase sigma factor [Prevotella sp.]MCM1473177.1 sigma-70 family RNA polymerase sigma factor [Muribaculaceae bacterium]MDE6425812.1 sigma-70 family RNA polymerase sigma factor [Ruminococcus sp.]